MTHHVTGGATDQTFMFKLRKTADGLEATGLTITDIDLQYTRTRETPTAKVDAVALAATNTAHTDNRAIEVDATDQPGVYRVDWPDAAFAAGAAEVVLTVKHASCFSEDLRVVIDTPVNVTVFGGTAGTFASGRPEVNTTLIEGSDATNQIRDSVVDDSTRIDASALNTLSGHDPGATLGTSTLTQTQVTGGAYALNSASFAFHSGLDFTTTQKAATLARVTLVDTVTDLANGAIDAATFAAGAIDASAIATDAFGALELAAGAASEIATAVRTELTTELGRIDVAVSTRLATSGYTAPLDAAGVRSAVGLSSANLDTQLGAIDDYIDTEVGTINTNLSALITTVGVAGAGLTAADDAVLAAIAALSIPTAAQNAAALMDLSDGVEIGLTPRQSLRLIAAASAGKLSGAATTTVVIRNAVADSKDRLTATVDSAGNRSAITVDLS